MASDVAALVSEMNDTLVNIRRTIDALSTKTHTSRLDQLEHQRDTTLTALRANFERETEDLMVTRRMKRDDIAERRKQEDEEIATRRLREDESIGVEEEKEDKERERRFVGEIDDVEDEMDGLMEGVETEAEMTLAEGRDKLAQLQERRNKINRLIDEQVQVPFPTVATRRRSRSQKPMNSAITSKPTPVQGTVEPFSDTLKAIKEGYDGGAVSQSTQQAGRRARAVQGEEDGRGVSGSESASRGSFESTSGRKSRTASVSSTQRGSRISAFGWIAGKIGLGEAREENEEAREPDNVSMFEHDMAPQLDAEVSDNPSASPGGVREPEEESISREECALENAGSGGGGKGAELPPKETNLTQLNSSEIKDYGKSAFATQTVDLEANSFNGMGGSLSATAMEHEGCGSSWDDGVPEQSRHPSANTAPVPQALDDAQDKAKPSYNQYHGAAVFRDEGETEADILQEHSTSSSRAESYVGTTTDPGNSEATLDIDPDPYHEHPVTQRTCDKESNRGFSPELQAISDIPSEESDAKCHSFGSSHPEDVGQPPMESSGSNNSARSCEAPMDNAFDDESFSREQPAEKDDTVPFHNDNYAEDYEAVHTGINKPSPTTPEELLLEDMNVIPFEHLVLEEEGDEEVPNTSFYVEVHQAGECLQSPSISTVEPLGEVSHSGARQQFENTRPHDDSNVLLEPEKHPGIELAPHAMDYSYHTQSVQLPDGTWSTGMVDERYYESLVAQHMVSSVIASECAIPENPSSKKFNMEEEDNGAPSPGEESMPVVAPPGGEMLGDEPVHFVYSSFAHDIHPVVIQLANGAWSDDPSDGEYEDALALLQGPGVAVPTEARSLSVDTPEDQELRDLENLDLTAIVHDTQSVMMQLASGAWALNPSEEEYESAAMHLRPTTPPPNHATPMMDPPASPISNSPRPTSSIAVDYTLSDILPIEAYQRTDTFFGEQASPGPDSKASDGEQELSLEDSEATSVRGLAGSTDEPSHGSSHGAIQDGASLPWSPFNSRIPLSPDASPSTQSTQLDEAHQLEKTEDLDKVRLSERHLTFGYEKESRGRDDGWHPGNDAPDNTPIPTGMPNATEATADSDSQEFMTPLPSADRQALPPFYDGTDTFHNAVDYPHIGVLREEGATTVHGHDELFDSDSSSEYEPDPWVDENGDPHADLGMPPPHHAASHGEECAGTPTTAILQPSDGRSPHHTPEVPPALEDNSDISPLSLRDVTPRGLSRGLAFSRHNPRRPVTPPSQTIPKDLGSHSGLWGASGPTDSTPMSLVSHSTLSSSPGSPVRDRIPEGHEPVIQNSWAGDVHGLGGSGHRHHGFEGDYEPMPPQDAKLDGILPTPVATHMSDLASDHSPSAPSPSTLIQKMRGIFEDHSDASPIRSRPSSGIFNPSRRTESPGYDVPSETRKGGFLNEAEDEVDERSALLGSVRRN